MFVNPKVLLCLVLGLSAGCSEVLKHNNSPQKSLIHSSTQIQPASEVVVLEELGRRLSVRVKADSWSALLEKVRPAFDWNGRDMMWIEKGPDSQPRFVLDEVYIYHPTNQPAQWVLLDTQRAPFDEWYGKLMGHNLHGVADVQPTIPVAQNDAGEIGDYAVVKSTHPLFGTVFEIGWQLLMANGASLAEENRRLYVFRDKAGQWHFVGEGLGEGSSKLGAHEGEFHTVETRVVWTASTNQDLPVQVLLTQKTSWREWVGDGGAFVERPDWTTLDEFVLAGKSPATLRRMTGHPYLITEKGDTFEKIAEHCAEWRPGWQFDPSDETQRKLILTLWRTALEQLNPKLPQRGNLPANTRVQLLSYGETVDRLEVLDKAKGGK